MLTKEDFKKLGFDYFTDSYGYWKGFYKKNKEDKNYLIIHISPNKDKAILTDNSKNKIIESNNIEDFIKFIK